MVLASSMVIKLAFFSFLLLTQYLSSSVIGKGTIANEQVDKKSEVKVGVVMELESGDGKMRLSCINMSLSEFYASPKGSDYKTRLVLHTRSSNRTDVLTAAAAALDLIKNAQVQAIIGPESSMQASFVIDLGEKAHVPIITFSATSPSLTSIRSHYFIRATQNDFSQATAVNSIVKAFGWREVVIVYVDNEYGKGPLPYLIDSLQEVESRVLYLSAIHPSSSYAEIKTELYKLSKMQTSVFIVHMLPSLGNRIFTIAKDTGMMKQGYVWIVTDGMANQLSSLDSAVIHSMQGVLGVKTYVPETKEVEDFRVRWKKRFQHDNPSIIDAELDIYGLWAYDAALALAKAVERVGATNFSFRNTNLSSNLTDLENLGISQNGPELLQVLSNISFKGLVGDFHLVNGQLPASAFQILNVVGSGEKRIGFWTPQNGFIKDLSTANTNYSASTANLGVIIWPGDYTSVPKGWNVITYQKPLRIGVPVKHGFYEFVNITKDPITNKVKITGFCIDVFHAVMQELPYNVPYEFVPFAKANGDSAGSYNEMLDQVYLQNYEAVVGDTTITANRSLYVDFTLPYTESGLAMIRRIKEKKQKNAWVFLKPLTWDLWVTSICFFIFIGFTVWVLEHRINEDFRGPPSYQVGTSFWFSLSTMVFAQRERVVSNLARVVVIVWCFVVLILTQSYTASWTSLLTVRELQPTIMGRNQYVAFQKGSFALGILKGMGFDESKLRAYFSPEECDELLYKGSANGGADVAFDEVPYTKLILTKYCSKYTVSEKLSMKSTGFGFVFRKGSPLLVDVSNAIMKMTEGDQFSEIEKRWFGAESSTCADQSKSDPSISLGLDSFWGLFLIAGAAAAAALIIFAVSFVYEHRHVLVCFNQDPEGSIWRKIRTLFKFFDQKDVRSHHMRKSIEVVAEASDSCVVELQASEDTNLQPTKPPDPSSVLLREQCMPKSDQESAQLLSSIYLS